MFAVCLIQVLALAVCGIAIGLVAGALAPIALAAWLKDVLPVPPVLGLYPGPLALAAAYGLLTALAFSLWPLGRAARIPGAALFRDALLPERTRPSRPLLAANATVVGGPDRADHRHRRRPPLRAVVLRRRAGHAGRCSVSAAALVMLAARAGRHAAAARPARLGLANLHRPGAATPLMLVSVGLGLSTLAAVALIQGNVQREITRTAPGQRAELLLRRHPGQPVAALRGAGARRSRACRTCTRCPACAPASSR